MVIIMILSNHFIQEKLLAGQFGMFSEIVNDDYSNDYLTLDILKSTDLSTYVYANM